MTVYSHWPNLTQCPGCLGLIDCEHQTYLPIRSYTKQDGWKVTTCWHPRCWESELSRRALAQAN